MSKFATLAALLALVLSACSGALLEEKLKPLMRADLEPGRGLGDVVLGETTLGSLCDRYGHARVSAISTDERSAIELRFGMGQLTFLFPVDHQFAWENSAALRGCTRDLDTAMAAHAPIRDALLTGISVRAAKSKGSTF